MPDAGANNPWQVWLLPPDGGDYGWKTAGWVKEPRLLPERFNCRTGNGGAASFRVLKKRRQDGGYSTYRTSGQDLLPGQWVLITCNNTGETLDWAKVRWWGVLSATHDEPDQVGGYVGSATAFEVGALLDKTGLSGWRAASNAGPSIEVISPTTFNLNGVDGEVIGNRAQDSGSFETLCRTPGTCGTAAANFWTRYRLLNYVLKWLLPPTLPAPTTGMPTDVQTFLDDTATPEIYDLKPLSVKGAFDLCMPRSRGIGWRLNLTGAGAWLLNVWSLLDSGETGIPVQSPTPVDLTDDDAITGVSYDIDESTWYDEVEVLGASIVIMGSLAASDTAWVNKWAAGQESTWKAGSTESLSGDQLRDACAKVREAAHLRDVFVLYGLGGSVNTGPLRRSSSPGGTAESGSLAWFPEVTWDGAALTVDDASTKDPIWTAARIARNLPWRVGVPGSGDTSLLSAEAKAQPTYLEPRVFIYDSGLTPSWRDLLVDEGRGTAAGGYTQRRSGASLEADDRGPNLRIRCSPPEYLAAADWTGIVCPRLGLQGSSAPPGAYDWRKMVVTVAIPSDQRVRVVKRRDGITAAQVRRRLVLEDEKLQAWYAHAGTVVGIKADGTPDRVTTATWTRNDFPTAEKRAKAAAAWALTARYTATISRARPDLPPAWADVGVLIGTVTDGATADPINSVVEDVSVTLGDSPAITVQTDIPDMPAFGGGGAGGGGAISLQLGGTVAQALSATQRDVAEVRRDLARVPVLSARPAAEQAGENTLLTWQKASHGLSVGDTVRPNGTDWVKAQADTPANAAARAIVVAASTDYAVLALPGSIINLPGLTAGSVYFLSDTTAGQSTTTAPTHMRRTYQALTTTTAVVLLDGPCESVSTSDPGSTAAADGDLWFKH